MSETIENKEPEKRMPISRRDFLRAMALMGVAIGSGPIIAGCAPQATEAPTLAPTSAGPAPTVPPATAVPPTAVPATEAPQATATEPEAKVLKIRLPGDIQGIDPAFMVGLTDSLVSDCVFSGLVRQKQGTYDWENDLVEEIKQSEDGKTIEFTIKQGVMFHKGYGELTTEDVKFSFERIADPAVQSSYASDWLTLDHVEVVDKYHGKIILKSPFAPLFASTLPVNSGKIVCKAQVDKVGAKAMTLDPIGTGPYIFDTWKPQEKVILKRNPDYYGTQPYFDEIDILPITDTIAAETALEAGEISCTQISLGSAQRFKDNTNFNFDKRQGLFYSWIGMNVENPKLKDINVRQAIRYGIDVKQILTGVFFGQAEQEYALIPPGLPGYWADAPKYERDVAKAKEFLSKAGLQKLDITYSCSNTTEEKAQAEIIQQNLAEVGINVTINSMDASSYWQAGMGDNGKNLELYAGTFSMYADPSWATSWFTCDQVGVWNWMRWCNKDFDSLHKQGVEELDPAKRSEIYIQMQKLWDEACISVWTTHGANIHVYTKDLAPSFTPHGQEQLWNFKAA